MKSILPCLVGVALFAPAFFTGLQGEDETVFPGPPGPHVSTEPGEASDRLTFADDQPIVGTYYFYWYDVETGEHFVDPDGTDALTRHPARREGYRYRLPSWHARELEDIRSAGIDFILPVYWGYPGDHKSWSFTGLEALVEGARSFERAGQTAPRIGCFYDTSTLRHNRVGYHADLNTRRGKEWLYVTVRDFFSLVPRDLRATIEGRPIVWLYSAAFAKEQDPAALDYLRRSFERDFGVEPFIVKEVSWQGEADATYGWGAALQPRIDDVAALGPGYDHAAVPGRSPLVREREDGAFYRRAWERLLALPVKLRPSICVIETWNEWHEGTDIAPSRESGDKYVELTRKYADLWHEGKVLRPQRAEGSPERQQVRVVLGEPNREDGLWQREEPDGKTRAVKALGKTARRTVPTEHGGRYMYFEVDDAFFWGGGRPLLVDVTFLDEGTGSVVLEYDSLDRDAPYSGAFKAAAAVRRTNGGAWRVARFRLDDAAFLGRANRSDFRLVDTDGKLAVHSVTVRDVSRSREDGSLRDPTVINDDGAWCWFQDERALLLGDQLVVGSIAAGAGDPKRRGNVEVVVHDRATGSNRRVVLHERFERDDHAAPAFVVRGDGRLLAMYTRHGPDNRIHYRITSEPGDASSWEEERVFIPSERSRVTYTNLHRLAAENDGRGRLYNFFRGYDDSFKPSWMTSDDGGESWTSRGLWIDVRSNRRHRPYVKYASDGRGQIHFAFTEGHPRVFDNGIYHAYYEDGRFHRSDGSDIAAVEDGPLLPGNATRVFEGDADNVAWISDLHLDHQDRPVLVYSVQRNSAGLPYRHPESGKDHRYRYARWDGHAWHDHEVAHAGTRLYPGEDDYTGNICIDPDESGVVFFSSDVNVQNGEPTVHGHYEIYRGETADLGQSWTVTAVTADSAADNLRPIVPAGGGARAVILWMRGDYRSYTDWSLEIVGLEVDRTSREAASAD